MLTPIRRLRQERDIPQWVLAERTGIRAPRLSMIELKRVVPRPDELIRIAQVLGVPADVVAEHGSETNAPSVPRGQPRSRRGRQGSS